MAGSHQARLATPNHEQKHWLGTQKLYHSIYIYVYVLCMYIFCVYIYIKWSPPWVNRHSWPHLYLLGSNHLTLRRLGNLPCSPFTCEDYITVVCSYFNRIIFRRFWGFSYFLKLNHYHLRWGGNHFGKVKMFFHHWSEVNLQSTATMSLIPTDQRMYHFRNKNNNPGIHSAKRNARSRKLPQRRSVSSEAWNTRPPTFTANGMALDHSALA